MTAHRITTAGNAIATRVVDGRKVPAHQFAPPRKVDSSFADWRKAALQANEAEDKPIVWGLIVWPVVVGLGIALMGLAS